ncbi:type II toxin-antitoxin system RelE/ParE family toxin [Bordetella sp. FB-8]|uniref:type II toxin-antitoxin system RelE/ParE family toxin n=1 Tax=Bordetella sp. FB-8 TaxID=1159870 RepID=UPI00036D6E80|nr:type II toxin-antitoxin system RelE/ParE family toxin [Bordetella sp. FB-8]
MTIKRVIRTQSYREDLDIIESYIEQESPGTHAGLDMWLLIDGQVDQLADSKFPRRPGRIAGTHELVTHENYIVILEEDDVSVTALNVVHARQQYP